MKRLLVIEHDTDVIFKIIDSLEDYTNDYEFEFDIAVSFERANEAIESKKYDVVSICDNFPFRGVLESGQYANGLARLVKEKHPGTKLVGFGNVDCFIKGLFDEIYPVRSLYDKMQQKRVLVDFEGDFKNYINSLKDYLNLK